MKKNKINWFSEIGKAGKTAVKGGWKFVQILINILITILLICVLTGIIVATAFTVYVKNYVNTSVDITKFQTSMSQGTTTSQLYRYDFTDRTNRIGTAVALEGEKITGSSDSTYVSYDRIPENMVNAVIAIEDKRFRTHDGVDYRRTIGAALSFFTGTDGYGGSSITQQLVKNVTGEDDYSIQRKIQEIFWALDLETKMDKEEILEMYLNIVNFGGSNYGVQAAAYNYFSKDVSELTLIECAAIAGITQNPSKYNPLIYPENNKERRDIVLYEMYTQGLITQREFDEAYGQELELHIPSASDEATELQKNGVNSWYTDDVIDKVIAGLMEEYGYSRQVASLMVYNGGLKIYTLIDPTVQATLEAVYLDDSNFREEGAESAAIVIDPNTGDILGIVGSRGEKLGNRLQNFATQTKRPSGSAIKPLAVYAQAIEMGLINWATVIDDTPHDFENNEEGWPKNDEYWTVNFSMTTKERGGNRYRGLETVSFALSKSTNTVAVKILESIGVRRSFDFCRNVLQMTDLVEGVKQADGTVVTDIGLAALALGQLNYGISVEQLTATYSIFVNHGIYNEAHSFLKVTDSADNLLLSNDYSGTIAISEGTSQLMNKMLEEVPANGTASDNVLGYGNGIQFGKNGSGIAVAGKTGSAGDNYDRWFIGYTPYYICGVWTGYEYNNKQINGTNPCLKVWDAIMTPLHAGANPASFDDDKLVKCTYCRDSGLLCTDACALDPRGNRSETGYFIDGTQPTTYCETHVKVKYCTDTNCIACPECKNTVDVGLVRVDRDFNSKKDISIADAQYTYIELPYDVLPYISSENKQYYYNLSLITDPTGKFDEEGEEILIHHYTGYTIVNKAYNRICTEHFSLLKWEERLAEEDAKRGIVRSSATDSSSIESSSIDSSAQDSSAVSGQLNAGNPLLNVILAGSRNMIH